MTTDKLDNLIKKMTEMEGEREVPLEEMLNEKFMQENTKFTSFEDWLNSGGFKRAEFEAIDEAEFDRHVAATTRFSSWEEMLVAADDTMSHLGLG